MLHILLGGKVRKNQWFLWKNLHSGGGKLNEKRFFIKRNEKKSLITSEYFMTNIKNSLIRIILSSYWYVMFYDWLSIPFTLDKKKIDYP